MRNYILQSPQRRRKRCIWSRNFLASFCPQHLDTYFEKSSTTLRISLVSFQDLSRPYKPICSPTNYKRTGVTTRTCSLNEATSSTPAGGWMVQCVIRTNNSSLAAFFLGPSWRLFNIWKFEIHREWDGERDRHIQTHSRCSFMWRPFDIWMY